MIEHILKINNHVVPATNVRFSDDIGELHFELIFSDGSLWDIDSTKQGITVTEFNSKPPKLPATREWKMAGWDQFLYLYNINVYTSKLNRR